MKYPMCKTGMRSFWYIQWLVEVQVMPHDFTPVMLVRGADDGMCVLYDARNKNQTYIELLGRLGQV